MPGYENMSSSKSSARGVLFSGSVDVNAGRLCECVRSCMSAFLRSLLAWCADLPAVRNDRCVLHGHGFALLNASASQCGALVHLLNKGLSNRSSREMLCMSCVCVLVYVNCMCVCFSC